MKWFLDTEFNEDGKTIELISIALVSEKLSTGPFSLVDFCYYAVSADFDDERIRCTNPWVGEHVLPHLANESRVPRAKMAIEIRNLVLNPQLAQYGKPEFWGYFADYDWVVFCQLFGRMIDLPRGLPMYCNDLKQLMRERNVDKGQLPQQPLGSEHSALADAHWVRDSWLWIQKQNRSERTGSACPECGGTTAHQGACSRLQ
jgi:hypothetical protein